MTDISIITTVYNCEKFINKSLHSILSQKNMPSFEWIICNDGSTDSTWDKIVNFDFKHITDKVKLIDDSENIRIPKRRNKAIKEAKGKYIAIQDGDDNSLDDRMRLLFDYLENNPDIFCVGGKAIRILEDDYVDQIMDYPSCSHEQIVEDLCKKKNPIIDPSCMYRKNIFFELNGYSEDEEIYTVPDMDLWCRAILQG